jgi:hypothetical protein
MFQITGLGPGGKGSKLESGHTGAVLEPEFIGSDLVMESPGMRIYPMILSAVLVFKSAGACDYKVQPRVYGHRHMEAQSMGPGLESSAGRPAWPWVLLKCAKFCCPKPSPLFICLSSPIH